MSGLRCCALLCATGTSTAGKRMPPRAIPSASRDDGGRVAPECNERLDRRCHALAQPGLEMMEGRIDDGRRRDLVDGAHGIVDRQGEAEVTLHPRPRGDDPLQRHVGGAGDLPVAVVLGVGLAHPVARRGLALRVDDHDADAEVVAQHVEPLGDQRPAPLCRRGHGHEGVAHLERRPAPEVHQEEEGVEQAVAGLHRVEVRGQAGGGLRGPLRHEPAHFEPAQGVGARGCAVNGAAWPHTAGRLREDVVGVVVAGDRERSVALRVPGDQPLGIVGQAVHAGPLGRHSDDGVAAFEHLGAVTPAEVLVAGRDVVPVDQHGAVEAGGILGPQHEKPRRIGRRPRRLGLPPSVASQLGAGGRTVPRGLPFEEVLLEPVAVFVQVQQRRGEGPSVRASRDRSTDAHRTPSVRPAIATDHGRPPIIKVLDIVTGAANSDSASGGWCHGETCRDVRREHPTKRARMATKTRTVHTRRRLAAIFVALATVVPAFALAAPASGSASASTTPGVTATTITVGIPYIDFTSLRSLGVNLDDGNFPDAYKALIANINAHGGVAGRKIVATMLAVSPTGSSAALTACTQLVENDKIFVAIGPEQSDCYIEQYHVPTIQGLFEGTPTAGAAPNFTILPPAVAYDPLELSVFKQAGAFKGKKVGLFAGEVTDEDELKVVQSALARLHVHVVQSGVDSAPATDQTAENQQAEVIAQRFENEGVNEVIAVGTGSAVWPRALQSAQSTYNPTWIATNGQSLQGTDFGSSSGLSSTYVAKVLSSSPIPSYPAIWKDPAIKTCASIIHHAYPSDAIAPPTLTSSSSDATFLAVIEACQNMAIFTTIADAAGRHLERRQLRQRRLWLASHHAPGYRRPGVVRSRPALRARPCVPHDLQRSRQAAGDRSQAGEPEPLTRGIRAASHRTGFHPQVRPASPREAVKRSAHGPENSGPRPVPFRQRSTVPTPPLLISPAGQRHPPVGPQQHLPRILTRPDGVPRIQPGQDAPLRSPHLPRTPAPTPTPRRVRAPATRHRPWPRTPRGRANRRDGSRAVTTVRRPPRRPTPADAASTLVSNRGVPRVVEYLHLERSVLRPAPHVDRVPEWRTRGVGDHAGDREVESGDRCAPVRIECRLE